MAVVMKRKYACKGSKKNKPDLMHRKLPAAETQGWAYAPSTSLQVTHRFLPALSTALPAAPDWGQQAADASLTLSIVFIMQQMYKHLKKQLLH